METNLIERAEQRLRERHPELHVRRSKGGLIWIEDLGQIDAREQEAGEGPSGRLVAAREGESGASITRRFDPKSDESLDETLEEVLDHLRDPAAAAPQ